MTKNVFQQESGRPSERGARRRRRRRGEAAGPRPRGGGEGGVGRRVGHRDRRGRVRAARRPRLHEAAARHAGEGAAAADLQGPSDRSRAVSGLSIRSLSERKWNSAGNGLETVWKRFGNGLETVWKRFGNGLETVWKWFGNGLETMSREILRTRLLLKPEHVDTGCAETKAF